MILVIGATGNIGKEVVTQLSVQGQNVRALIHVNPPTFGLHDNIQLVHGDLNQPDTIEAALDGVDKIFLLSTDPNFDLENNAIEAAKRTGVKHIVRLSRLGAGSAAGITVNRCHNQLEELVRKSGIPFTILRSGAIRQSLYMFLPTIKSDGCFYSCTGEGRMSLIDTRDIAAAAARVLTEPGHAGKTYTLTGFEALSYGDVAARFAAASGKPVAYVDLPAQVIEETFLGYGFTTEKVAEVMQILTDLKNGEMAPITNDFTYITGQQPRPFDEFAAEMSFALNYTDATIPN